MDTNNTQIPSFKSDFMESTLEDIIFNTPQEILRDRGLGINYRKGFIKRQLRIGNYGIADIVSAVTFGDSITIDIFELKRGAIDISTFMQSVSYLKGIQRYFEERYFDTPFNIAYNITLIGSKIDTNSSFVFLPDLIGDTDFAKFSLSLYTYSYEFDGIKFTPKEGYRLTDEGFNL